MGYDSLSGKTDKYVREKENLNREYESFSDEAERFADARTDAEKLDEDIQEAFRNIQHEFDSEQEMLQTQQNALDSRKSELVETINRELDKLNETQGRLDSLSGKKYIGGVGRASEKCKDYISQLEGMLDQIDVATSHSDNNSAGLGGYSVSNVADKGIFFRRGTDNKPTSMSRYARIVGYHSIESDLVATNPHYSQSDSNSPWNNNCQRCVSAYEARRRGYDVQAQPIPEGSDHLPIMMHPQGWPSVYKDAQLIDCSANTGTAGARNVEEQMRCWGENCRAIVRVRWKPEVGGGGHVFIAERTNGITRFIDPQDGTTDARSYFDDAIGSGLYCMRIDDLEFTDRIHQCCL